MPIEKNSLITSNYGSSNLVVIVRQGKEDTNFKGPKKCKNDFSSLLHGFLTLDPTKISLNHNFLFIGY